MNKLLKALYDCFCAGTSGTEAGNRGMLPGTYQCADKPERRLVLQIIDAKDRIVEDTSIDSFISGFELAWQLSTQLNQYEKERSVSRCKAKRLGALSMSRKEDTK